MDKIYQLLYVINSSSKLSQRKLSSKTGMSLGMINSLIKNMKQQKYICINKDDNNKSISYKLTDKGQKFLENILRENQEKKLIFSNYKNKKINSAIILAAGEQKDFSVPVGLLEINNLSLIDRIINTLEKFQIDNIYIVIGFKADLFYEKFKTRNITLIENNLYKRTGTMHSLSLAKDYIKDDFILIESDHIFEDGIIKDLLDDKEPNAVVITEPSGSEDEAFIELNQDNSIFRISKDIHQMNRIDAELLGISKISYPLFEKMIALYSNNKNPYINYEYIIENIGRIFRIAGIKIDDAKWCEVDNLKHFNYAKDLIYPEIKIKEDKQKTEYAKSTIKTLLELKDSDIKEIKISGGMTNLNYYVKTQNDELMLRIPGAFTESMLSRENEKYNGKLATLIGINSNTIYFNEKSGIKITEFISNAQTLDKQSAKLKENIEPIADLLYKLHNSHLDFINIFNVFNEYNKYKNMLKNIKINYYQDFFKAEEFFYRLKEPLNKIGFDLNPCHNDLVPENFIKSQNKKLYLIDWEYSGMNDPMWDIASFILECEFSDAKEELFLKHYFKKEPSKTDIQKIFIFKICQDFLWSMWTLAKETKGESFGDYGKNRFKRCLSLIKKYEETYE